MSTNVAPNSTGAHDDETQTVDAIIMGAGFAGLRMLIELRRLGISARVLETGTDVGGTWYWNRYPGASTDSESWVYCYQFDHELLDEWDWQERFPGREEVMRYLRHVADRYDLRRDIDFQARVVPADYDEDANLWTVVTDAGRTYACTYFISATGLISVPPANQAAGRSTRRSQQDQGSRGPSRTHPAPEHAS